MTNFESIAREIANAYASGDAVRLQQAIEALRAICVTK